MRILVTGGAGYIGSHAVLRLLEDGHAVTVVDDLSRGHRASVTALSGLGDLACYEANVCDVPSISEVLSERRIELVMHFAAKAYVGESVHQPLAYYRCNVGGTIGLLEAMSQTGVSRLVFSSTCAVYGKPIACDIPITEQCPTRPINPYGHSKLMCERVIADCAASMRSRIEDFAFGVLRYFNVAGSDPGGRIGEDHRPETHLIPICLEAAGGERECVTIHGISYATEDGTCVRDYVHVCDLIDAHVRVMDALRPGSAMVYNVGVGRGHSVREVIGATQRVTGVRFPVIEGEARTGDPPILFSDAALLRNELCWMPQRPDLETMIADAWQWRQRHPHGYAGQPMVMGRDADVR